MFPYWIKTNHLKIFNVSVASKKVVDVSLIDVVESLKLSGSSRRVFTFN